MSDGQSYFLQDSRLLCSYLFFNDLILFVLFTFKLHQFFQVISFPYYLVAHMRIYLMHSIFSGKFFYQLSPYINNGFFCIHTDLGKSEITFCVYLKPESSI